MKVTLRKTGIEDDEKLWRMQVEAFQSMYEKYQDTETSPAAEGIDVDENGNITGLLRFAQSH